MPKTESEDGFYNYEMIPDALIVSDKKGDILYLNTAALELLEVENKRTELINILVFCFLI